PFHERLDRRLRVLARFPRGCFRSADSPSVGVLFSFPFAAGGPFGQGRALVLADHSIFINDMMLRKDNDNLAFAASCIDWLTEGGKRNQVLMIDEGEVVTTFQVPLQELDPPMPGAAEMINHVLLRLEEGDGLYRFLAEQRVRGDWVQLGVVALFTLGLIVF